VSRAKVLLAAGAVLLGLVPQGAQAGHDCREHYPAGTRCADSDVTIRQNPDEAFFAGRVVSHMRWCERERVVVLREVKQGPDPRVGKTRTNREGRWRIDVSVGQGRFYGVARFKERRYGIDSHDICYRARSRSISSTPHGDPP
jgi:hypothetical protein